MKPRYTDLSTVHFARDQAAIQLPSESAQSIFYSSTGSLNHANLRRHLQPLTGQQPSPRIPGTSSSNPPPRLVRQDAFLNEETSSSTPPSSDDTPTIIPAPGRRRCKVCFSMTEPLIQSPCQCWDPPNYIHQSCLIDMLSSTVSSKHCSSCHSIYNVNMLNTLRRPPPPHQRQRPPPNGYYRGSLWKTIMIVAATTLIMETYRCTELQQIPGSELDDDDDDYIWLPVVQHHCWQESLLAMFWRSMKSYPLLASVSLILIVVVICILDKLGY